MMKYIDQQQRNGMILMVIGAIWFCYTVGYFMGRLAVDCGAAG